MKPFGLISSFEDINIPVKLVPQVKLRFGPVLLSLQILLFSRKRKLAKNQKIKKVNDKNRVKLKFQVLDRNYIRQTQLDV